MGYWRMPRSAAGRVIRQGNEDDVEREAREKVISIRVISSPINRGEKESKRVGVKSIVHHNIQKIV